MERARARTLVDQMQRRGVDLLAGLPAEQAETLRKREAQARGMVSQLEKQLGLLDQQRDLTADERKRQSELLRRQIAEAQKEYVGAYGDIRSASPAYRLSLAGGRKAATLERLLSEWGQEKPGALVIQYFLGEQEGFALIVPPSVDEPRIEKLLAIDREAGVFADTDRPLRRRARGPVCSDRRQEQRCFAVPRDSALGQVGDETPGLALASARA